eukprot:TRINITY_DN3567_c0_g1_i1.p1 TRINITY_DN3567_c0_g1~~TRINITY_DN3567_c0_g1_i1.p1  ORF type:complete len:426 (-),score=111.69 TRINITY_DN3567_c0_g1_i1:57-1334(-)
MSHSYVEDLKKLERSKGAKFTLEGVIAARSPESGQRTHDSVTRICETIIGAYRTANGDASAEEKRAGILKVRELTPELEWLVTFTDDETRACRFPSQASTMKKINDLMASQVNTLKADFQVLATKLDVFHQIFDVMLALLEQVTEFLKAGHGVEVLNVIEQGKNAYAECSNLLNIEVASILVPQSKLVKDRAEDFLKKCKNLVNIQEGTNKSLKDRVDNVELLLQAAIPNFILKSRDHLINLGQPHHGAVKEEQIEAHKSVVACLDEIGRILERVKAKYANAFDEDGLKANRDLDDLDKAANNLFKNLAKLKVPSKSEEETQAATQAVPALTKEVLTAMANHGAQPEHQRELIGVVKGARDGTIPEFFEAAENMENLLTKVREEPAFQIAVSSQATVPDEGPRDLLEAAKAMCAALKGLNIAVDQ